MYLPGTCSCYDIAWGIWEILPGGTTGEVQIKNVLLNKCIRYNETCGINGITNTYLDECDQSSATYMVMEDDIVHGECVLGLMHCHAS